MAAGALFTCRRGATAYHRALMRDRQAPGPALALIGAIVLLVTSFLPWYRFDAGSVSGTIAKSVARVASQEGFATSASFWKAWGLLPALVLIGCVAGIASLAAARFAGSRSRGAPAAALLLGLVATALVVLCAIGHPGPKQLVTTATAAWVALAASAAIVAGAALWFDEVQHPGAGISSGAP